MIEPIDQLLTLAHDLGQENRRLAILGEGNVSVKNSDETFLVKASGSELATLMRSDVTECRFAPLLELLEQSNVSDKDVDQTLNTSKVSPSSKRPSTEAVFHAYLLSLPGINCAAHTHPIAVNGILCSTRASDFANRRMFPDEIVCCGPASVLVPYIDPGAPLARAIKTGVEQYQVSYSSLPKMILLGNHGIIALAATAAGALAATLMAEKSAEIFNLAASHGGPVFLSEADVDRIENRRDEHYRRGRLGI